MIHFGLYSMTLEEAADHYSKTYVDPMNNLLTPEERTARRAAMVTGFLGGAQWVYNYCPSPLRKIEQESADR